MPRATQLAGRTLLGVACAVTALCAPTDSFAQRRGRRQNIVRVALGEMGASRPAMAAALTGAVEDELRQRDDVTLAPTGRAELVLRGSVVRMERHRVGQDLEVRCEVSVIVADARGGSIRAMLRGRAGARGRDARRLSDNALRAAVRGALRPLGAHGSSLARAR